VIINGTYRMNFRPGAKKPELRIRRRFEFIVREDLDVGRVIYRDQTYSVKIGNFVQLFSDMDPVLARVSLQRGTRNLDVFPMIDWEVVPISRASA
jgi:hypothetical protein